MNRLVILFLSILLSIVYSEDEFVYTLDQNNFNTFISSHPGVLVEFYAPWCGHCKALAPEYEKAAKTLRSDPDVKTVLAKVDATTEKTLASKYGIKGFPTLKYFSGSSDKFSDYTGGRTEATIVSWIKKRELPSVTFIKSKDEFEKIKSKNRVVLVGFFQSGSPESDVIQQIGDVNRDSFVVAQVTDANVAKEVGVDMGSLILYRQFDEPSIVFSGDKITKEEITKFVNSERFALIEQIGPENYKDYIERGIPLVWVSLDPNDEEMKQKVIEKLSPYAKENKGKLSFTWINAKQYQQHVNNLGITSVPGILIAKDNDKYLYHGDIENDGDLKSFFSKYTEGSLEKFLKSQEPPIANNEPVYVLVGKSFSDVIGHDKDVLVEFYAPWCGHCKKLAPEYEKVGEAFKEVNDLVIAKIDATENDTPEEIRGFPTLIFYPKNTTKGIKYQGERTSEAIIAWIKEQASVDLSNLKSEL